MTKEKVVIIGGTSGMGLATASLLTSDSHFLSYEVIIAGRDKGKLDKAVASLDNKVKGEIADATSEEGMKQFYSAVGDFDHLVLTLSGAKGAGMFRDIPLSDIRDGFEAKFWGQLNAVKEGLPSISAKGSITFISAISAQTANPGTSGLSAINGAIESIVRPLAAELAPIRVNAVSPGVVDTPWWDLLPSEQRDVIFDKAVKATLVGRIGKPEDIASVIALLLQNSFMTGVVIACDGGFRLRSGG